MNLGVVSLPGAKNDDTAFQYKQVIVVRTDLGMSTGKLVAQACHASIGSAEEVRGRNRALWKSWLEEGGRKIVVGVGSKEQLLAICNRAGDLGIPRYLVEDRGLTEIPPGSITALGVGPERAAKVDRVTGNLPLLK